MFIYSKIWEKNEDIENSPFVFEKNKDNLQPRKKDEEYGHIKMKSYLNRPKKTSQLYSKAINLKDLVQDVDKICVSPKFTKNDLIKQEATYKERYFIYHNHTLI